MEQTPLSIKWPETVTELHAHLGGSVPLYRLWEIAIQRGIRGMGQSYEEFIDVLKIHGDRVKDLDSYLEVYDRIELIQSGPQAIRESVIIALHRAYLTGGMPELGPGGEGGSPKALFSIGRFELRWNPLKRTGAVFLKGRHAGLYDVDRVIKEGCAAIEDVELGFRGKLRAGLIFCFGRDMTYEANMILAKKVRHWAEISKKVIGLDLAGPESANPLNSASKLAQMKSVFDEAGPNLGRTVHVGETPHVDLDTFIKTIEALEPHRVAHPIVAFRSFWERKDDRGLKLIKERGLTCEFCVKSNVLTNAVRSIEEYADVLRTADEFGIDYTFSTDAPCLQVSSLAQELLLLLKHKAATEEQILRALATADRVTFLPK